MNDRVQLLLEFPATMSDYCNECRTLLTVTFETVGKVCNYDSNLHIFTSAVISGMLHELYNRCSCLILSMLDSFMAKIKINNTLTSIARPLIDHSQ